MQFDKKFEFHIFFSYCMCCRKQFTDSSFARFPNGVIVRKECVVDKSVCPLTGAVFKYSSNSE